MPFIRDHGTCCLVFPLKLGVGVITMLVFAHSILCMLALVTGDIRFQPNGYNDRLYLLPVICGVFGLVFGFVGLLGAYDDKLSYLRAFNRYLCIKLVCMLVAIAGDGVTLNSCDTWAHYHTATENVQLFRLSEAEVCPWARASYALGSIIDMAFWLYLTFRSFAYEGELFHNPPYKIDFGREKYDIQGRWQRYKVQDPRLDLQPTLPVDEDGEDKPLLPKSARQQEEGDEGDFFHGALDSDEPQAFRPPMGIPVATAIPVSQY